MSLLFQFVLLLLNEVKLCETRVTFSCTLLLSSKRICYLAWRDASSLERCFYFKRSFF